MPSTANLVGDWRVSGRTIHVKAETKITTEYGPARVGSIVEVEGYQLADNSIDAKNVEVESQPSAPIQTTPGYCRFYGVIKVLPATQDWIGEWTVGGIKVNVMSTTTLVQEKGAIAVGVLVEGLAIAKAGGLEAVRIEVSGLCGSFSLRWRGTGER